MSRREARAARAAGGVNVDGLAVPPELVAGWLHPAFDADTVAARAHSYDRAVAEFAERLGLVVGKYGRLDWPALERLGIHRVKAIDRARAMGMCR